MSNESLMKKRNIIGSAIILDSNKIKLKFLSVILTTTTTFVDDDNDVVYTNIIFIISSKI